MQRLCSYCNKRFKTFIDDDDDGGINIFSEFSGNLYLKPISVSNINAGKSRKYCGLGIGKVHSHYTAFTHILSGAIVWAGV